MESRSEPMQFSAARLVRAGLKKEKVAPARSLSGLIR
jgi:hypothetical protein